MRHSIESSLKTTAEVFDVVSLCRAHDIDECEIVKLVTLVGQFASRFEIEMNLTKRRPRFR